MKQALEEARERRDAYRAALIDFLRIPSISAQPVHAGDVRRAANWLADALRGAGLENVAVVETDGHPLVYADWLRAGPAAPTVLVYGHYDVQPPDPLELWATPPFEPTFRDDFVYARGASDDKGQSLIHVHAAAAMRRGDGRLPCNVKYLFEGEEETGGANLAHFVPAHKEELAADVALISDTDIRAPDQPALVYGLRGMCYLYVDVAGPDHDLHSGTYGGGIDNPLNALAHIIAALKDRDGRVLIPGFYDRVAPLTDAERARLARRPFDAAEILARTGAPALWGEPEYTFYERVGARPTLDVHGIVGGYIGPGSKTVLPSQAHAKISMRLVPDQDPDEIYTLARDYILSIAPETVRVTVSPDHGAPASVVDVDTPAMRAAAVAYETVFGNPPHYIRGGGSIPVVDLLQRHLGVETVLMGFGLPDDRIHSPNERFYMPNYFKGIETVIRFLHGYAAAHQAES